MDPTVKAARSSIYKSFNLGGITNWAVDLQDYQPWSSSTGLRLLQNADMART